MYTDIIMPYFLRKLTILDRVDTFVPLFYLYGLNFTLPLWDSVLNLGSRDVYALLDSDIGIG